MFTLAGFSESQDSGGVLVAVAALPDPHIRVEGDNIVVPEMNQLMGVYGVGLNLTQAQLDSPTLRRFVNLDISPFENTALPAALPAFVDRSRNPITLTVDEQLRALVAEDAAGAVRDNVLVWLGDGVVDTPAGEIFTVRVTGAITCVANAWTNGALTFSQALPAGRYALVGARFESANLQAFRFVSVGGTWRPGGIGQATAIAQGRSEFRKGYLGVWLEFAHNTPPTIDLLANAADAAQVGFLDLIQVG